METLERILKEVRYHHTTSQPTKDKKYKCELCRDTTWIKTDIGYKRCSCYEKDLLKRLWNNFGVNPSETKKINDYKTYDDLTISLKEKAVNYINSFDDIRTDKENSYGLFGQSGAGKSHIVLAIGAALLKKKLRVVYMPYLEAMRQLKANVNEDEYYLMLSSRYQKCDVLVIDDLFKDKVRNGKLIRGACITEADMKHIYPVLNYRYFNNLPIIFSTECTPEILLELDEALAGRIIETCEPYMTILAGSKYNYRMRKFMK